MTDGSALTVIVISADEAFTERATNALFPQFQVIHCDPSRDNIERLLASCGPAACMIDIDGTSWDALSHTDLIETVRGLSNELPIIFTTFDLSSSTLIPAFRAGANDVVDKDFASDELLAQVDRLANRQPLRIVGDAAPLCVFVGAREGHGSTTSALAVSQIIAERAGPENRVLLLDFSHPPAKVPDYVGARANYFMTDGVHDLPRLDVTMVDSAILRAWLDNLYVLPLASSQRGLDNVSVDELVKLTTVLRTYFSIVIAEIAWPWRTELATRLFLMADCRVLCTSQSITAVHSATEFLEQVRETNGSDASYQLAITRYDAALSPSPAEIQQALGAVGEPYVIPEDRRNIELARNAGEPLVRVSSRGAFAKAIQRLATTVTDRREEASASKPDRQLGMLKRVRWRRSGPAPTA